MLSLRPSHGSQAVTDHGIRLLYIISGGSAIDSATTGQLIKAVGKGQLTEVESAAAALTELRSSSTEYRALLISPGFSEPEALALIRGLRNEGAGVAIVPVVTEAQRGLCSSAVRAGAEAVLLMVNGVVIDAQETLGRILPRATSAPAATHPPATVAATKRALAELRKLHALLYGKGRSSTSEEESAEPSPGEGGRLGLTPTPSPPPPAPASPAGADVMAEKPRATHAAAATATTHLRRPVLASVPAPRAQQAADKTFDGRTRAALEAALQASRVELRRAADAHAAERDVWEATRKELEARVDDVHAESRGRVDLEAELTEAKKKFGAATDAHAVERTTWDATRRELEMRVKTLQAVIGSTRKIEAELKTTQAELQSRMSVESTAEAEWAETRARLEAELESRAAEIESANTARSELEAAVLSAQAELHQVATAHADATAVWEEARDQLQEQIRELQSAAGESARHDSQSVEEARAEIDQARRAADEAASVAERARADAEALKAEFETRGRALEDLRAEHARLAAAYRGLEGKLSEARERVRQLSEEAPASRAAQPAPEPNAALAAAEQRREVSRVEQVGKLGAAMAPEIETLVSSIDQAASKIVRQLDPSSPQRAELEAILKSSSRATSLVRQLISFSRRQAKPLAKIDLNEIVKRAEPSVARLLGSEIELKLALGPAGSLAVGEDDVEQILTALAFSARESLTMGGSVVLSTAVTGGRVQLSVTAFGYGVQPAKSSSALDGVVKRCGGELTLGGDADRDAVVQVSLPQA